MTNFQVFKKNLFEYMYFTANSTYIPEAPLSKKKNGGIPFTAKDLNSFRFRNYAETELP